VKIPRKALEHIMERHGDWVRMLGLRSAAEVQAFLSQVVSQPDEVRADRSRSSVKYLLKKLDDKLLCIVVVGNERARLGQAAAYVKGLLNTIEHPLHDYEKMVVLVATSKGVSRREIGRHRWADLMPMWNMGREGFEQLYEQIPGPKPDVEEAWRLTGGNPEMLANLHRAKWDVEAVAA
jgi:hypothetical protein